MVTGRVILALGVLLAFTFVFGVFFYTWPFLLGILAVTGALDVAWCPWAGPRDRAIDPVAVAAPALAPRQFRLATAFEITTCCAVTFSIAPYYLADFRYPLGHRSPLDIDLSRAERGIRSSARAVPLSRDSRPTYSTQDELANASRAKEVELRRKLPLRFRLCLVVLSIVPALVTCAPWFSEGVASFGRRQWLWLCVIAVSIMLVALPLGPYVAVIGVVAPLLLMGRFSAVGALAAMFSIATLFANLVPRYWRYDALSTDLVISHHLVIVTVPYVLAKSLAGLGALADAYSLPIAVVLYCLARHATYQMM